MENITDLKAILNSKRANIYYLEYCRVMQKDGRVLYLSEAKKEYQYWNIPIANTTCLLLGTGTSITQAAMRMLSQAGVLVGFCGGGATPLFMANEIEWFTPQSEYRPTEYIQGWMQFWFDESKRLETAKRFQIVRIEFIQKVWIKDRDLRIEGFNVKDSVLENLFSAILTNIPNAYNVGKLLQAINYYAFCRFKPYDSSKSRYLAGQSHILSLTTISLCSYITRFITLIRKLIIQNL